MDAEWNRSSKFEKNCNKTFIYYIDDDEGDDSAYATQPGTEDVQEESQRPLSPFTGEDQFTHATQDEHHGARRPSRIESLTYHYRRRHREDIARDSNSWSNHTRRSLLESFDFLSIRDPTNPYDYIFFGGDS